MKLVIVTCNKDKWHFLIQCKSFAKYLEPCEIFITINEDDTTQWMQWFYNNCKHYLDKFKYTLHTRQDFNLPKLGQDGYANQQAIKLLYSEFLPNDIYCVFDTKNWLIKNTSIIEIPLNVRHDNLKIKKVFYKFFTECTKHFGDLPVRNIETPYIVESKIVSAMLAYFGDRTIFLEWFLNTDIKNPSEFILYDMFAQYANLADMNSGGIPINKTFWPQEIINDTDIENVLKSNFKILGIHRLLLPQINIKRLEEYYEN